MTRIWFFLLLQFFFVKINAQTVIQMVEDKGVYKVPCEVNGLKVKMVFDTGAAAVSLSQSFAEMMLDNDYISKSDFVGQAKSITADGRIIDHTEVMLRSVRIGDILLNNVKAIVINSQDTPLLFGQTAIQMLGEVSIKGDKLFIKGGSGTLPGVSTNTHFERWDAQHFTYTNYSYGFGWDLPQELDWERMEGQEKHTVFRAQCKPFAVFVNAQVSDRIKDLWAVYGQFTTLIEQTDLAAEKKTGLLVYERDFEKCTLLGQHAIKTSFKEYFKDSRYKDPMENYAEEYMVIMNGYVLTIALKMPKSVYDAIDCSEAISEVFRGFRFSVKH